MAKIEHGKGKLISVDTEKKILRFQEIRTVVVFGSPAKEWEHPYALEWPDREFFDLVGKHVEYVLSDGSVVSLKLTS